MSWSEIKKAVNSNIDVPLNEKITRSIFNAGKPFYYRYEGTAPKSVTALNIDSKLILKTLLIRFNQVNASNTGYRISTTVKVESNEEVLANIKVNPNGNSDSVVLHYIYFGDLTNGISFSSSQYSQTAGKGFIAFDQTYVKATSLSFDVYQGNRTKSLFLPNPNLQEFSITDGNGLVGYVPIVNGMFLNGLKVTFDEFGGGMYSTSHIDEVLVEYELLE